MLFFVAVLNLRLLFVLLLPFQFISKSRGLAFQRAETLSTLLLTFQLYGYLLSVIYFFGVFE